MPDSLPVPIAQLHQSEDAEGMLHPGPTAGSVLAQAGCSVFVQARSGGQWLIPPRLHSLAASLPKQKAGLLAVQSLPMEDFDHEPNFC